MDVLILAAGLGSRVSKYTHDSIPKYLINIDNHTGLYYLINYWNKYANNIYLAIRHCLFDKNFRELSHHADNPYWLGDAGIKIADILAKVPLGQKIIRKQMTLKGEVQNGWYR